MRHLLLLAIVAASPAAAQSIKPHPLGPVQATSTELLGSPSLARSLPNGSVIVNDVRHRQLLLFDATLASYTVIADSTSGAVNGYGPRPGALIPYVADSTLFLDATASSFLVIDPAGKVTRVMSPPRPGDNNAIASVVYGFPGFDARGRMVYRTSYRVMPSRLRDGSIQMPTPPDSAPLIRVDLDTRRADTVGVLRLAKSIQSPITMGEGRTVMVSAQVPLATIDDWAVLSDGTIAMVRGQDYHVDFIRPDGSTAASERIPFDWKRLTDDDKLALADSIQKERAAGPQGGGPVMMFGGGEGMRVSIGRGGGGGGGGDRVIADRVAVAAGAAGAAAAGGSATPLIPDLPAPAIADMPDYMPAFTRTSARPDADGNLWIRTTTPGAEPGNLVYDVISSQGALVDRVDVPKGMAIIGFGKGGIVYLAQREGYGFRLSKVSVK